MKWAVDNRVGKGQIVYLIHVKLKQKPHKSANFSDDSLLINTDAQLRELFLPFRCFCARKEIKSQEVVLEDTYVVKRVVGFAARSILEVLVIGAPPKGSLLKYMHSFVKITSLLSIEIQNKRCVSGNFKHQLIFRNPKLEKEDQKEDRGFVRLLTLTAPGI